VCSVVLLALLLLLWRWMCHSSPPFFSVIPLCVLWFLHCLLGLRWSYPLFFPAVSDCGGVVSSELGLSSPGTESVPVAPWSSRIFPPPVGVGRWVCVVCDLALVLVLVKVLAILLVFVPQFRCVFRCTVLFVSRDVFFRVVC